MDQKHLGYTNYETALVALQLEGTQEHNDRLQEIARSSDFEFEMDRANALQEYTGEAFGLNDYEGLAESLISASLARVDWRDILKASMED